MKHAPFQGLKPPIFRQKMQKQNGRADALDEEAALEHHPLEPDDAVDVAHAQGLSHHQPLL